MSVKLNADLVFIHLHQSYFHLAAPLGKFSCLFFVVLFTHLSVCEPPFFKARYGCEVLVFQFANELLKNVFRLISAEEQGIFGDAAMLERRDLDVGKDLVLIFFLGYRTIHKHSPADVFASTNSLMPVVIAVVSQRVLFSFLLSLD